MRFSILCCVVLLTLSDAAILLQLNVGGGQLMGGVLEDTGEYRVSDAEMFSNEGDTEYASAAVALGSDLIYRFPLPGGTRVKVTAQFIETWDGAFAPGARVMDVYIGGDLVWKELDVYAEAGGNTPFDVSHTLTVEGDAVEVGVIPIVENPMLSGVIIESVEDDGVDAGEDESVGEETQAGDTVVVEEEEEPLAEDEPSVDSEPGAGDDLATSENGDAPTNTFVFDTVPSTTDFAIVDVSGTEPLARHENCGVFCNGKYYLIGGRFFRGAYAFNPTTSTWSEVENPNVDIHHGQCVCIDNCIYVAGAWFGEFPAEETWADMAVYDTSTDSWSWDLPNPSGERLRGSGAVGASGSIIYFAGGSTGGHGNTTVMSNYTDMFDTANPDAGWQPLQDLPDKRDHTGGAVVGNFFCVAGGRNGSVPDLGFWDLESNLAPIHCLDLETLEWEVMADLPNPRAGASVAATCYGKLMVAGGEVRLPDGTEMAYDRVDIFDPTTNTFGPPLKLATPRHGTGVGIADCECGNIYIAAGAGSLGGGPELNSTEVWAADGTPEKC